MTVSPSIQSPRGAQVVVSASDGLGRPEASARGSWRARVRSTAGLRQAYRVGVFVVGLLLVALGFVLPFLPGPTLLGLWIWSTEFSFAQRVFQRVKLRGKDACEHARARPVASMLVTVAGLAATGAAVWAVVHYELIDKGRGATGIG
jgi:hypothetical protein